MSASERPGTAVITGAGSGIGAAIARALAARGWSLGLIGRRADSLEASLAASGGRGSIAPADVRDEGALSDAVRRVESEQGTVDLAVAAAGVAHVGAFVEIESKAFRETIDTNLVGAANLFRAVLPGMVDRGRGHLVPLLSVASRQAFPGWSAYCASKWGLLGLVESLREDLRGSGVRISAVTPGATESPLWDQVPGQWNREAMLPADAVARAVVWAIEAGEEVAVEEIRLRPPGGPVNDAASLDRRELQLLLFATPIAPLISLLPGGRYLFPLLVPLALYPGFARAVRAGDYAKAFRRSLVWALLLSVSVILFVHVAPRAAADGILNAEPYRQEMFGWIETGVAKENDWRLFLPEHLLHLGLFVALAWVSGGYLALALGAALTAYMSYFVGSFSVATGSPFLASVAAWVPWSVVRVLAFVALGCILARPLLLRKAWPFGAKEGRWVAAALLGILTDLLVKANLAPAYGLFLRRWLAGE